MIVNFYDIDWDMSDDDIDDDEPNAHIMPPTMPPTQVTLTVEDDIDISLEGADVLSDHYGWCVNGFNFDILEG